MPLSESTVVVVLSTDFGDRLLQLASQYPVWIVRSEGNDPSIQKARQDLADTCDVTSFHEAVRYTPEEEFLGMLDTVYLHHPWNTLIIFGCLCSDEIRTELQRFAVVRIDEETDSFSAHRAPQIKLFQSNPTNQA